MHGARTCVQRRGCLIQNEQRRVPHKRPGNGDALALAPRQQAVCDGGGIAGGEGCDKVLCVGQPCCPLHILLQGADGRAGMREDSIGVIDLASGLLHQAGLPDPQLSCLPSGTCPATRHLPHLGSVREAIGNVFRHCHAKEAWVLRHHPNPPPEPSRVNFPTASQGGGRCV